MRSTPVSVISSISPVCTPALPSDVTTFGCTTMKEANLLKVLQWLVPEAAPHYVMIPKAEYARLQGMWKLPKLN